MISCAVGKEKHLINTTPWIIKKLGSTDNSSNFDLISLTTTPQPSFFLSTTKVENHQFSEIYVPYIYEYMLMNGGKIVVWMYNWKGQKQLSKLEQWKNIHVLSSDKVLMAQTIHKNVMRWKKEELNEERIENRNLSCTTRDNAQ